MDIAQARYRSKDDIKWGESTRTLLRLCGILSHYNLKTGIHSMKTLKPVPGFSKYGITQCARLFNLKTKREIRTSSVYRGYQKTNLVNDSGKRQTVLRHRLVALTHLPPPDNPEQTSVNHIDHTPGNDHVSNLEWCTPKENTQHATAAGRMSPTPIQCESLDEKGVIVKYHSVKECASDNNVSRLAMASRLLKGDEWIWPCGKRFRMGHSDTPWSTVIKSAGDGPRMVAVRDLITNQITTYSQLQHVIPLLGYTLPTIWKWINHRDQVVLPGLYQIQYLDELKPWRHVEDIFGELEHYTNRKVVVRFDADWSNPVCYESARICGYHNNIANALHDRLKWKGQRVWSDKYRYVYYSDLNETQQYEVLHTNDAFNDYRKLQSKREAPHHSTE